MFINCIELLESHFCCFCCFSAYDFIGFSPSLCLYFCMIQASMALFPLVSEWNWVLILTLFQYIYLLLHIFFWAMLLILQILNFWEEYSIYLCILRFCCSSLNLFCFMPRFYLELWCLIYRYLRIFQWYFWYWILLWSKFNMNIYFVNFCILSFILSEFLGLERPIESRGIPLCWMEYLLAK